MLPPLQVDLLTLKVVSESHVTRAISMPIVVFLGLSVLDLGPMYATDRCQTSDAHNPHNNAPTIGAAYNNRQTTWANGHSIVYILLTNFLFPRPRYRRCFGH